jgi:hypothetical protein
VSRKLVLTDVEQSWLVGRTVFVEGRTVRRIMSFILNLSEINCVRKKTCYVTEIGHFFSAAKEKYFLRFTFGAFVSTCNNAQAAETFTC